MGHTVGADAGYPHCRDDMAIKPAVTGEGMPAWLRFSRTANRIIKPPMCMGFLQGFEVSRKKLLVYSILDISIPCCPCNNSVFPQHATR